MLVQIGVFDPRLHLVAGQAGRAAPVGPAVGPGQRPHPEGVPVAVGELPPRPRWRSLQGVLAVHAEVARLHRVDSDDLHLTLALERPGPAEPTDDDLEWSEAVEEQLAEALAAGCSFHVVDAHRVVQLLPRSWWPR